MSNRITFIDTMQKSLTLGGIVNEVAGSYPSLGQFPISQLTSGIEYTSMFFVGLPTVGFRKMGDGQDPSKGRWEERKFKAHLFGGRVEVEKAAGIVDSEGLTALQARQARLFTEAAIKELASQIFYGVANEEDGFPGLKAFTPFGGAYTYNAGGTTSNGATSIYGVKFGEDYASMIYGPGDPLNLGDWRPDTITGNNGKPLEGLVAQMEGWIGMALKHKASVMRICNITAQSTHTASDDMVLTALDLLPTGMRPDVFFMSKQSRKQIRDARSTPERPTAELPRDIDGIPIIVDDSILNTDAVEA